MGNNKPDLADDAEKSAENLVNDGAGPVGPAQPIAIPKVLNDRRILGNGDTDREADEENER